jgi:hypothetical protein
MCKCLAHSDVDVRVAVATCLRVLARPQDSITQEHLGDGLLADSLVQALQDNAKEVSTQVCYAITNFVSTPSSPARQQLFEKVRPRTYCCCWDATTFAAVADIMT